MPRKTEDRTPQGSLLTKRGTIRKTGRKGGARIGAGRPAWYPPKGVDWSLKQIAHEYIVNKRRLQDIGPLIAFGEGPGARNRITWFLHDQFQKRMLALAARDRWTYDQFIKNYRVEARTKKGGMTLRTFQYWLDDIASGDFDLKEFRP